MKIHKWKNNELNRLLMEKFNFGGNTLNEGSCGSGNKDEDQKDPEETINEMDCMGQGSRDGKKCPECGEENCPGRDGKKVNEGSCSGNADEDERDDKKKEKLDVTGKGGKGGPDGEVTRSDIIALAKKNKGKKEKQEESFRDSVRKLMEEIIGLQ